jgi:hypothetical protein
VPPAQEAPTAPSFPIHPEGRHMSRYLGLGAALGALFALTSVAAAGDETMRLDLKKSSKTTLTGSADAASPFTHDARAKVSDDDVEDVFYGYRRGYYRGSYGGGYFFPRFYPYRAGYRAGSYGGGYYGGGHYRGGYYGGGYGYRPYYASGYGYRPYYYSSYAYPLYAYAAPVQTYIYSAPVVEYYDPAGGAGATRAATNTLELPPRERLPMPQPKPKTSQPMPPAYPYDGPAQPKSVVPPPVPSKPSHRYDGGPDQPVPMPPPDVNPSGPTQKGNGADGRVVKLTPTKKPTYQAYGDNRRKTDSGADRAVVVKKSTD